MPLPPSNNPPQIKGDSMETVIIGTCVAIGTGIGAYSLWKTRHLAEEINTHTTTVASVRNDVANKAWLQSKSYSEDLDKQHKAITKMISDNEQHLEQLLATITTQNKTLDSSLSSLKGYISNTKQELSSVIDGKFGRYKENAERINEDLRSLERKVSDLERDKSDKTIVTTEIETVYSDIAETTEELNKRMDELIVAFNKVTIDKLAKGEREIYEMLKLGAKQKDIAKRLHTSEPRVSAVKKQLIEKGLLEQ